MGCNVKQDKPYKSSLSGYERDAIIRLDIDSTLILELKSFTQTDFEEMGGAPRLLYAIRSGEILPLKDGVDAGYFNNPLEIDKATLKRINDEWSKKGYSIYLVKGQNFNRLMIKVN